MHARGRCDVGAMQAPVTVQSTVLLSLVVLLLNISCLSHPSTREYSRWGETLFAHAKMDSNQAYAQFERNGSSGFNVLHLDDVKFVKFARSGAVVVAVSSLLFPLLSPGSILGKCSLLPCSS